LEFGSGGWGITFNLQPSTFNLQPSTFNQLGHGLGLGIEGLDEDINEA
jgi:hypothetical protein